MNKKKSELTRQHAAALSIFGMLLAVVAATLGILAWQHGLELDRIYPERTLPGSTALPASFEYACFAIWGAPPLILVGVACAVRAALNSPRPPEPPTSF